MSWWCKEPEHEQPWYWLCWTELIWSPHGKGSLKLMMMQRDWQVIFSSAMYIQQCFSVLPQLSVILIWYTPGQKLWPFLAATKQLYEWYFLSVCPSVRLSVCPSVCPSVTPFWLCSHHRIIMKFSGVITLDQGKVHAKGQGQRSKVKVTEVTTQIFVSGL